MQQKKFYPLLFSLLIIANLAYITYFWLHTSGPALLAGHGLGGKPVQRLRYAPGTAGPNIKEGRAKA